MKAWTCVAPGDGVCRGNDHQGQFAGREDWRNSAHATPGWTLQPQGASSHHSRWVEDAAFLSGPFAPLVAFFNPGLLLVVCGLAAYAVALAGTQGFTESILMCTPFSSAVWPSCWSAGSQSSSP